ncbi:hypothetical protein D3C76_1674540 [compost metagenome]
MRHHFEPILLRRQLGFGHKVKLFPQLLRRIGNVTEPLHQIGRRVEATQIEVAWTISEPAPHLHERVIHLCRAHKVAHTQPLQR